MADSKNKTVHFQYKISCISYQSYGNRNHLLNYYLCDHWFYPFRLSCQMAKVLKTKVYTKDHDNHANHAEHYLV